MTNPRRAARPVLVSLGGIVVALVAGGCHKDAPGLDAAHLPRELAGLVPGAADEAAVAAALPRAERVADRRLGGTVTVELNDEAAISFVDKEARTSAWLVKLGDAPRVAMVSAHVTDGCAGALATLGDHATPGTCSYTNRKFSADEHELCARTPDGKYLVSIECVGSSGELSMWVKFNESGSQSRMINRN